MPFANIKGAAELIDELNKPLENIEKDIAELKENKEKLQAKLDSGENRFKLSVVKKNKDIQSELDLIERTLKQAEKEREIITKNSFEVAKTKAQTIIRDYKKEIINSKKKENAEMIKKIIEIRGIFAQMVEEEKKATAELQRFVKAVSPFISNDQGKFGTASQLDMLEREVDNFTYNNNQLKFIDVFNEGHFGIKGLITKGRVVSPAEHEAIEKYGVKEGGK